jgi:hypothetical protein
MRIEIHLASSGFAVRVLDRIPWVYGEYPSEREARYSAHSIAQTLRGRVYSMLPVPGAPIKTRKLETLV